MIALFCGSRSWTDVEPIKADLAGLPSSTIIVHGGADGADTIAEREAGKLGLHTAVVRPLYVYYPSRAAPIIRNGAMLLLKPDVVYAYRATQGSGGTGNMIHQAQDAGVRVVSRGPR